MKLERMNEQQIRCTLTKEDLAARKIELSELAYGTDKARSLFRELMTMAADELDFVAEDIPLMIEAVPMNSECIVLIVTKVEDPEELDTRFAQFSPSLLEDDSDEDFEDYNPSRDFMPLPGFDKAKSGSKGRFYSEPSEADANGAASASKTVETRPEVSDLVRLFSFESISTLMNASKIIAPDYNGDNALYKDSKSGCYLLLLSQSGMDLTKYNRICNIISEYGNSEKNLLATGAYLEEHCEQIIGANAISRLASA